MGKERFPAHTVKTEIWVKNNTLMQRLTLPDGQVKESEFEIHNVCDEGAEHLDDLARDPNFKYPDDSRGDDGTQRGWHKFLKRGINSRDKTIIYPLTDAISVNTHR
jgi:hypothetical protein